MNEILLKASITNEADVNGLIALLTGLEAIELGNQIKSDALVQFKEQIKNYLQTNTPDVWSEIEPLVNGYSVKASQMAQQSQNDLLFKIEM